MNSHALASGESARLSRLRQLGLLDADREEVLDGFTRLASDQTGMPYALLSFVYSEFVWIKSAAGVEPGTQVPRLGSLADHALNADGVFEVVDARADTRFADHPLVVPGPAPRIVHYAAVPIVMPGGERIGTLSVIASEPGQLQTKQRQLLQDLAAQIVRVLLLRESERELHRDKLVGEAVHLSELAPVGMFSADVRGRMFHCNRHWVSMLGAVAPEDGFDAVWRRVIDPRDLPDVLNGWSEAVKRRQDFHVTFRTGADADGANPRWIKMRVAASSFGPIAFVGTAVDITETVRLEEALQVKNALLEGIVEYLPSGLAVFDRELRHVASNPAMRQIMGLPNDLFEGSDVSYESLLRALVGRAGYSPAEAEAMVADRMAAMLALEGEDEPYERRMRNGTVVEIRTTRMPEGSLISVFNDVTQARTAARQVRTSERRLALALETSRLGLWEIDFRSQEVYLSPSWARLLGYPEQERKLTSDDAIHLFPRAEQARVHAEQMRLFRGETDHMALEHRMNTGSGKELWVLTEAQVTEREPNGRVAKVIGTIKDISARVERDTKLRAALAEADRANQAKTDFLATMSHEIRTPLNGVIGLTQLLAGSTLPQAETESVQMIDSCAKSLLSLVDNILDLSKIEAGKLSLTEAPTDLHKLVYETGDVFAARAAEKGIHFELSLDARVPQWVQADPGRVRQILLNLLGNALKFTERGSFSLRVRNGAQRGMVEFAVSDSGIGISPGDQARLFTRFTQVDASASRRHQGTGLGLAISRELAELMGGDVTLESRLGEGSTFTLRVPLQPTAPCVSTRTSVTQAARSDARILLAEDNEVNQRVSQRLLAKLGYTDVTPVYNGVEAVAACRREHFDLVLMDCQMPEMDGLQATRELRKLGMRAPVIAFTASATSSDREACAEAGMDDYLTKPVELSVLADKLHRWLAEGTAAAEPAPRAAAEAAAPVFEPSVLQDYFFDDLEFFGQAREVFIRQAEVVLRDLGSALPARDWTRVRALAHKLRGSAGTAGAPRLFGLCAALEDGVLEGVDPPADWLDTALPALEGFVSASAQVLEAATA